MPRSPKWVKLIDIAGTVEMRRVRAALEKYLDQHTPRWTARVYGVNQHRRFVRYFVKPEDLCCAQAVIPALDQMAQGGPDAA